MEEKINLVPLAEMLNVPLPPATPSGGESHEPCKTFVISYINQFL